MQLLQNVTEDLFLGVMLDSKFPSLPTSNSHLQKPPKLLTLSEETYTNALNLPKLKHPVLWFVLF